MKRLKMRAILALSVALSMSGFASAAGVLDKVPADAWNVVKFSNLSQTNTKIAQLAEKLGLTFFRPEFADPLGTLKKELKITNGLQDDGELAFVQFDPKEGRPEQSFLFIVPTNDFKALVGNIEGATAEGDLTVVTKRGQTTYFADWGGYAAISQNKDLLAAPSSALQLTKRASEKWDKSDIVVYSNFNAMREKLAAGLAEARTKATTEMPEELKSEGKVEEKYHPALITLVEQGLGIADAFVRDADATTIGLTLSDTGIAQSVVAEFKGSSYLADTVNSFQTTEESLLKDLPGEGFGVFMGFMNSPAAFTKVFDDFAGPVLAKLPADDEKTKLINDAIADGKKIISQVKSGRTATLSGETLSSPDTSVAILEVENESFLKDLQALNEKYTGVFAQLQSTMTGGVEWKQTYTAAAKTVDGVSFDLMSTEIVGEGGQAEMMRNMLKQTSGTDKMDQYFGMVGNKMVMFSNASDDTVSSLITSAKTGGAPLAEKENVKAVMAELPKARALEFYLSGEPIFRAALRMVPLATGMPVPNDMQVQLPPDLPPIGVTISKTDGALEIDSFVSSDLLQAMMTAGLQLGAEMMNPGAGGKNDGGI